MNPETMLSPTAHRKGHILWFVYIKCPNKANYIRQTDERLHETRGEAETVKKKKKKSRWQVTELTEMF